MTASLGIATFGQDATTAASLIEVADQALYRAKHAGRNRVSVVEPSWSGPVNVEPIFRDKSPPGWTGMSLGSTE